ncbi:hypothetical protein [Rhodopirellula bahusiensis]|uniref:Secreted protein n=1 Tax=Rhodopirellula bahusiensis TaxID=2014065 RepID=A0A2G1W6G5_9BACT|nr:hypothetical protein [Rhodopirellula bahusiensis]PHQ34601.1 hypothetical protein CEE69_14405 [Rhodopirellula bahusiensis]
MPLSRSSRWTFSRPNANSKLQWPAAISLLAAIFLGGIATADQPADTATDDSLVEVLNRVEAEGVGHTEAMKTMSAQPKSTDVSTSQLFATLNSMSDAKPRAKNWLRLLASQQIEAAESNATTEADTRALNEDLLSFFNERAHDGDARYLIYRHLVDRAPQRREPLLEQAVDDPFIPLRYLAIQRELDLAEELEGEDAIEAYLRLLPLARHPDHLRDITASLKQLDRPVQLAKQLAMIMQWQVIAPFGNKDSEGFDQVYEVETKYTDSPLDTELTNQSFAAKSASANAGETGAAEPSGDMLDWQSLATEDNAGMVDLNPTYDNAKDAIAYAVCFFELPEGETTDVQARLGCINANKAWVNGKPILSNEVYHSGSSIDQYVSNCQLRPGLNSVLLKICQNNQTQPWAQDWHFQFRLTDSTGRGIPVTVVNVAP